MARIHVSQTRNGAFDGWLRCTVDEKIPEALSGNAGTDGDGMWVSVVRGRRIGDDTFCVDVRFEGAIEDDFAIDTAKLEPTKRELKPPDATLLASIGAPTITSAHGDASMLLLSVVPDGAAWLGHWRARVPDTQFCADLWSWHYPDMPGVMRCEVVVCASDPRVDRAVEPVAEDVRLEWGGGSVLMPQIGNAPLLAAGDTLGAGQARSYLLHVVWPHMLRDSEWETVGTMVSQNVAACGISRLYQTGNPPRVDAIAGVVTKMRADAAFGRLAGWDAGPYGVAARSTNTGYQEDQIWVGSEAVAGPFGAQMRYAVALGQSRRPCHHLEADGSHLYLYGHPSLFFWSGRPGSASQDQLGKTRWPAEWDSHGWYGPDREHWLINTLAIAARMTGSKALQWQLEACARQFWFQETINSPSPVTNSTGTARDIGWAGMVFVHLMRTLEDRELAGRILGRYRQRVQVYVDRLKDRPGGVWDPRTDNRITADLTGYTQGVMWWQQAVGSLGLDLACDLIQDQPGRQLALDGALAVLRHAWRKRHDGSWCFWDNTGYTDGSVLPESEYVEGRGAHRTGWFDHTWAICGIATILRHMPDHVVAREIWQQHGTDPKWALPGMEVR